MMQMLAAGGLPVLHDGLRAADEDNPRGYFEWERIRSLPRDPGCIAEAEGKAVKVISPLLRFLPADRNYKVVFLRRPLAEVAASQSAMIARRKTTAPPGDRNAIVASLGAHLNEVTAWLTGQAHLEVCWVDHASLMIDARRQARMIADFLAGASAAMLDVDAMAKQVVPSLHRQRSG
jgi:hypothetical protein